MQKLFLWGARSVWSEYAYRDGRGTDSVRSATQKKSKNFAGRPRGSMRSIRLSRLKSIHRAQSSVVTWLLLILEQSLMEHQLLVKDCRQKIGRSLSFGRELCATIVLPI
jgi:hypothetical protein